MKTIILATALAIGTLVGTGAPAAAQDYAYCLQGRQAGYPGDCSFKSFQQCKAAASGTEATCGRNPMSFRKGGQRN